MFKNLILFFIILSATACNKPADVINVINPITGVETGIWQVAFIVEAKTNFSSLLYDKTEAEYESFDVFPVSIIPAGSKFYLIPKGNINEYNVKYYNDTHCRVVASYLTLNGFGKITKKPEEADYFIVVDVQESIPMLFGQNSSSINISILNPEEELIFLVQTKIISKSDKNFYYRASKEAKPASYLTLKGFEKIFKDGLPQAFL